MNGKYLTLSDLAPEPEKTEEADTASKAEDAARGTLKRQRRKSRLPSIM